MHVPRRSPFVALALLGTSTAATAAAPASLEPLPDEPTGRCQWSDMASIADELSTMTAALAATELADQLAGDGPFTVFAPTNEAFDAIPDTVFNALLADEFLLESVLRVHIVAGQSLTVAELLRDGRVETLGGELTFTAAPDGGTQINGGAANVVCADVVTDNAVVHLIDRVLQPVSGTTVSGDSSLPASSSLPGSSIPPSSVPR